MRNKRKSYLYCKNDCKRPRLLLVLLFECFFVDPQPATRNPRKTRNAFFFLLPLSYAVAVSTALSALKSKPGRRPYTIFSTTDLVAKTSPSVLFFRFIYAFIFSSASFLKNTSPKTLIQTHKQYAPQTTVLRQTQN